ncbi:MAG: hypothetical protein ACRCXB_03520 [Aeromonadaceae bacterium]
MQQIKTTSPLFRRTTIAFALLSALAGQAANAKTSDNVVGPIHGRQIVMDAAPTIAGDGIVGTKVTATVPGTSDPDGDALVDWKFVWKVGGTEVEGEADASSTTVIPAYTVRAEDAGKKLELCLKAVAEERSYPVATRFSEQQCSTEFDLVEGSLTIADLSLSTVAENADYSVTLTTASNNNPNPVLKWELDGGADAAMFAIDEATGKLTMAAKDFEAPEDVGADNTYIVTVKVTDTVTGATATKEITVTVTNVVEDVELVTIIDGAGNEVSGNPLVGTVLHTKVTLDDGKGAVIDRTDATYKWQRAHNTTPTTWNDISGATEATYTVTAEDQGYLILVDVNGK